MAGFNGKKSGGFRGGNSSGGFRGADRGDRPVQLFRATCAQCGNTCEVPFRPNGEKPVFCRDCFASKRGNEGAERRDATRGPSRDFTASNYNRGSVATHAKPIADNRIDDLKRQVESMNKKLDTALQLIEGFGRIHASAKEVSLSRVVDIVAKKAATAKTKVKTKGAKSKK